MLKELTIDQVKQGKRCQSYNRDSQFEDVVIVVLVDNVGPFLCGRVVNAKLLYRR